MPGRGVARQHIPVAVIRCQVVRLPKVVPSRAVEPLMPQPQALPLVNSPRDPLPNLKVHAGVVFGQNRELVREGLQLYRHRPLQALGNLVHH